MDRDKLKVPRSMIGTNFVRISGLRRSLFECTKKKDPYSYKPVFGLCLPVFFGSRNLWPRHSLLVSRPKQPMDCRRAQRAFRQDDPGEKCGGLKPAERCVGCP